MEVRQADPLQEIRRLERCLNQLVSVLALPAVWTGGEPEQIVSTLAGALVGMLGLDFLYVRLAAPPDGPALEIARVAPEWDPAPSPGEIGERLRESLDADTQQWARVTRNPLGDGEIRVAPLGLGLQWELGMIVAGSERMNFPEQTERLVLTVAANQAAIGLQEARLLAEQKRVTRELDERVAQRTAELIDAHGQVARSEERWRSVFENSAVGVALTDLDGRFIATNPVFQKMLGYTEDEFRNLTLLEITHEECREANWRLIQELLAGARPQFQVEKQYRRKDGKTVWVTNSVSLVPGTERTPQFLMALSEDITERKQAEEALAATRAKLANLSRMMTMAELTASIAHEVNQPLAGIVTNASTCLRMLAAEPPNVEGAIETARRTIRDGNRASEVIARLRSLFSRKQAAAELLDLNEAASEVLELAMSDLKRDRVLVRTELAGDLPLVTGDRVQLQQVILNLLRNAADAMRVAEGRSRELLLRTEREEDGGARVSVKDSGTGIDPQTMDRLFEAFYTTKREGMGMGLSISRSIIESHQGRLWAAENDGPGAIFSFSIPCRTDTSVQ